MRNNIITKAILHNKVTVPAIKRVFKLSKKNVERSILIQSKIVFGHPAFNPTVGLPMHFHYHSKKGTNEHASSNTQSTKV